jgi:hypothetical protein
VEPRKDLVKWDRKILLRMENEKVIMAVWTPKVAIRQKEDRTNPPRPIHERSLQKPFDLGVHLFLSAAPDLVEVRETLIG